ncbi:DNA ligase D [uncultured Xylophilus sp.]|uniref:DNA ligase D n=1 Tax=uncultured Xylophilus sp. TaxID=296832 RepID=UPI0025DBB728|nr:DNA ligase D [uncultured Xylophilus sp.]
MPRAADPDPSRDELSDYRRKRDFAATPEPRGTVAAAADERIFVVQKHDARQLHYDFRLELDGTLKSWAVPKGPSLDPSVKRMAVQVEDHPLSYAGFEGSIPEGHYGAGDVIVWDAGTWQPEGDDPAADYRRGRLQFTLQGRKLQGRWNLVRMKRRANERSDSWLLMKDDDAAARATADYDVLAAEPDSVLQPGKGLPAAAHTAPRKKAAAAAKAASTRKASEPNLSGAPAPAAGPKAAARLPSTLSPELATLVDGPPPDPEAWSFEAKLDGYRLLVRVEGGTVQLLTRTGKDWTPKMQPLAARLKALGLPDCWIDGEVVAAGPRGTPDFQALQGAFDGQDTDHLVYFAFDLPFCDGEDLRRQPLEARRDRLRALVGNTPGARVRFCETLQGSPQDLLAEACRHGFEGLIGKRRDSAYVSRRSPDWIKLKCLRRQEFVIGGWTDPQGTRSGLGALLLGVHDAAGALQYVGLVGTGFDADTLADLRRRLDPLARKDSPFAGRRAPRGAHFVRPTLVAEIAFSEWTRDGALRHPVFHGLRTDKPAREIVREQEASAGATAEAATAASDVPRTPPVSLAGLRITHPERVIDAASGTTKLGLLRYYAEAAGLMLPHLDARPAALLRLPSGVGGETFFQKHAEATEIAGARRLAAAYDPGHAPLLLIDTPQALLAAVQMNTVEFHTWNAVVPAGRRRAARFRAPDRMTFDLDPGEGVGWPQVREAAQLLHAFLSEMGLVSFLKTSGGKGLHVVVPLVPALDWDTVKDFSQQVAQRMATVIPDRFVAKSGPRNRVGRIYIDYLRNGFGATTVAAWSVRGRPGLGVSVPVGWDELPALSGGAHWTVATVADRFEIGNTPWDGYAAAAQPLDTALEMLSKE